VIHIEEHKTYLHFVTFRKEEKDFAPTTRYKDYPISRSRLHWESQAGTTRASATGRNYFYFRERGYTILFFARLEKQTEGRTSPFLFLGPASDLLSAEGDRPSKWSGTLHTRCRPSFMRRRGQFDRIAIPCVLYRSRNPV